MFWPYCIFFLLSLQLYAEELDPIDVSATKELSNFHLGSEEALSVELNTSSLLSESIESAPGVVASQNGGPGSRTSYFVRGTEARHISFTIDDLKINDPSNTDRQFDAAFLTSPFLREITLYKGPQAVLFGSDAMGGLLDMRTRKGENAPETRLTLNAGSFGTIDAGLSRDWQSEQSRGTLTWTSFRTDGLSRLNKKRFNARERDGTDITQVTSSSVHSWNKRWETDFLTSFLRGNSELDGSRDDNSHDESRGDQYLIQQRTMYEATSNSSFSIRNGVSRHQRKLKTLAAGENSFAGDLFQNELLYKNENDANKLIGGISSEEEQFDQSGQAKTANLQSVFAQSVIKRGVFDFLSGLRADTHSRYGSYFTGTGGIGIFLRGHSLSFQYSQGLKAPSLYQLHAKPLSGSPIGNKDLVPERNNAMEVKWSYQRNQLMLELTFFRNALSNLITYTDQGYKNQARFIAQGVEASVEMKSNVYRLRPFLTLQEFKEEKSPVLRRPTRNLGLNASWFPVEWMEVFGKLHSYNHRKDMDSNSKVVKLNGFETLALGMKFYRGPEEYGIQVLNVTNREYEELFGYSVVPRSVFLNYGRKF